MRVMRTEADLRAELAGPRREGQTIGLVPTMGALHEGHLALIRAAVRDCDLVVVSVFVNPAQFNDTADLRAYPRDEQRDVLLAESAGADLVFAPSAAEVYPPGFATNVRVTGVSEPLEGAARGPGHFDGVATVVTKLFTMTGPHVAYFGRKDAQQVAVVRRLVRDLNLPVRIVAVETVREADGLALSSRNVRLSPIEREQALALRNGLDAVRSALADGADVDAAVAAGEARMRADDVEPEYLAVVDPETFAPVADAGVRPALVAVAAHVGDVRLIDNDLLS